MARHGDGIHQRGPSWFLTCEINGVRHHKKLGRGITRSVALELARVERVAILKGEAGIGKKKRDLTLHDASKRFLDWVISDKKRNTLRGYKACLNTLGKTFGTTRLSAITPWALEAYKKKRGQGRQLTDRPTGLSDAEWTRRCRVAEGGAPVRANRELAVLKSLYSKCRDWGVFEGENPVCKVKFRKEPRQRLRFLEPEEEARLLAACPEPLRTLVLVGIHTGIRLEAEAKTLTWASVDLKRGILTVESAYAKNGKTRNIPLNSVARPALEALQRTAKGELVFVCGEVGFKFRVARKTAGIAGVTPHTLRHTFASRLVMSGVDLRTVQELGGWQTIAMVERYAHLSPGHKVHAIERLAQFSSTVSDVAVL